MVTTIGGPITVGVMEEADRFSFILILKDFFVFSVITILGEGDAGKVCEDNFN